MMGCIALLVFLLFHHPLQQWAEAEEQDGGCCRHDDEDVATKEINLVGGGAQDVNGDGIVDTQDVLEIYKYIQEH